ncbi:MAG: hypothetical protein ACI4LX_05990 [Treponema sp.]
MKKFGLFILLWVFCIIIYRTYIRVFVFSKYKSLIEKLNIDRFLLYIPEISPLSELKKSDDLLLKRIYKVVSAYKILFWGGFIIATGTKGQSIFWKLGR